MGMACPGNSKVQLFAATGEVGQKKEVKGELSPLPKSYNAAPALSPPPSSAQGASQAPRRAQGGGGG